MNNDKVNISGYFLMGIILIMIGSFLMIFKYHIISFLILLIAIVLFIISIRKNKKTK